MRLLFKQKLFSWLDSYDIYNEEGETLYTVKGQLSWGHCFKIFDASGNEVGQIKEVILSFMPRFEIYMNGEKIGSIRRELSFFKPKYDIDYNGWHIDGNFWEFEYRVVNSVGSLVASISKDVFKLGDTYVIDVCAPQDALSALMLVVAIDAEKCSRDN